MQWHYAKLACKKTHSCLLSVLNNPLVETDPLEEAVHSGLPMYTLSEPTYLEGVCYDVMLS